MSIYEVTIKFKKGPWYTGIARAGNPNEAKCIVLRLARIEGFTGGHSGIEIKTAQEGA